jgi:hypothetical protein
LSAETLKVTLERAFSEKARGDKYEIVALTEAALPLVLDIDVFSQECLLLQSPLTPTAPYPPR